MITEKRPQVVRPFFFYVCLFLVIRKSVPLRTLENGRVCLFTKYKF